MADRKPFDYLVVEIGTAGDLTDKALQEAVQLIENLSPMTAISICVGGYDHDPRELWNIPEALEHILKFARLMDERKIPPTRLLQESFEVIKGCYAKSLGKKVSVDGVDHPIIDDIKQYLDSLKDIDKAVH